MKFPDLLGLWKDSADFKKPEVIRYSRRFFQNDHSFGEREAIIPKRLRLDFLSEPPLVPAMALKCFHSWCGHPWVQRALHHPLFLMWVFVVFSLSVKECFPFSHFPMYSNLASGSHYFYLADENDEPVSVKLGFGMAASSMKKMYHSHLTPMAEIRSEEAGKRIKASELGPEDQALAGDKLFDYLMPRGEKRRWWRENHPKTLRLFRVDIKRSGTELSEDTRLIYERPINLEPEPRTEP